MIGGASAVGTASKSMTNPSVGIFLTSSTALLSSVGILNTTEMCRNYKFVTQN